MQPFLELWWEDILAGQVAFSHDPNMAHACIIVRIEYTTIIFQVMIRHCEPSQDYNALAPERRRGRIGGHSECAPVGACRSLGPGPVDIFSRLWSMVGRAGHICTDFHIIVAKTDSKFWIQSNKIFRGSL